MPVGDLDWNWCCKKGKVPEETSETQWTWIPAGKRRKKQLEGNDTVLVYPKPANISESKHGKFLSLSISNNYGEK